MRLKFWHLNGRATTVENIFHLGNKTQLERKCCFKSGILIQMIWKEERKKLSDTFGDNRNKIAYIWKHHDDLTMFTRLKKKKLSNYRFSLFYSRFRVWNLKWVHQSNRSTRVRNWFSLSRSRNHERNVDICEVSIKNVKTTDCLLIISCGDLRFCGKTNQPTIVVP